MLDNLPLEILEYLCCYVNVEDLMNVWDVSGLEGSESFWRKICMRQGYKKLTYESCLWKNVFLRNFNWLAQCYVKRSYNFDQNIADVQKACSSQNKELLVGKHLIINSCKEEALVWNLNSSPNLVQSLSAKYLSHKGNKLLTYSLSKVSVYLYNTHTFSKLYELPLKTPFNFHKFCSFTEDFLVIFDISTSHIKTVDLRDLTESSLMMPVTTSRFFSFTLSNNVLFILTLEESTYKIKRVNLTQNIWLEDVVLFQYAVLIGVPQLEMSSNLIVSWSSLLEAPGITPVKVFGVDGKYIATLPCTHCLESIEPGVCLRPMESFLWMIVECDYLIFSTSKTKVSIWCPENENNITVIPKDDQFHIGQKVVSSSLLVLSYSYCFKVIDFKKSVYLYEVLLDRNQCLLNSFQSFIANEYCYIHFQYVEEHEFNTEINTNPSLASSLCLNHDTQGIIQKKCFLHIYDFTGKFSS